MLSMVRAALPLLVSVTVRTSLVVLTCWCPKLKLVGLRLTAGADAVVPLPLKATDCGLPDALSVIITLALRLPAAVGGKPPLMKQATPAPTSALQPLQRAQLWAKFPM